LPAINLRDLNTTKLLNTATKENQLSSEREAVEALGVGKQELPGSKGT
jgi:hypothetical protein